ncbi:MAG TPA: hydroxymethylbilane synthase [Nitrospiria bacterium]|nr:hydroxymethylbilane synthase [Nitrospiria bacterium]
MSEIPPVRLATRGSPLALWQANWVKTELERLHAGCRVELLTIKTSGDKITDVPLAKVGGKGLFVKEIEEALLAGRADLAVHSMKDVPVEIPAGLHIAATTKREDPRDALISTAGLPFAKLPKGAKIGTSSLRRGTQLRHTRPDLQVIPLRGNLDTRLRKLKSESLDAVIVAAAGLRRMGWEGQVTEYLSTDVSLPAIGQGALGLECRVDDARIHQLIAPLNDADTAVCVKAERAFLTRLEGGCQVPIAGHAELIGLELRLRGLVANLDGTQLVADEARGPVAQAAELGKGLAERLLDRGAGMILKEIYSTSK